VALQMARNETKLVTTRTSLLGWSLGALEAAHVAELDEHLHELNFRSVLLMNPPVDVLHSIKQVDGLMLPALNWSPERRAQVRDEAYSEVMTALEGDITSPEYFEGLEQRLHLSSDEIKVAIGEFFKASIGELIYATQQMRDLGILKTRDKSDRRRLKEASNFSFMDYINLFVMRVWQETRGEQLTLEQLNIESGLGTVETFLWNKNSVFIIHNQDDILVTDEQLQKLEAIVGPERITIYPFGGHLGNLWYPTTRAQILKYLQAK
jgi:pimeloyl-ACP methyl ester carboxylesterase